MHKLNLYYCSIMHGKWYSINVFLYKHKWILNRKNIIEIENKLNSFIVYYAIEIVYEPKSIHWNIKISRID